MSFTDRRRDGSEGRGVEGKYIPCNWCRDFVNGCPTSAKDIHWTSSFLQPPTDS